jgi:hypothetical protein
VNHDPSSVTLVSMLRSDAGVADRVLLHADFFQMTCRFV